MSENNENFEIDLDLLDASAVEESIVIDTEVDPLEEPNPVEDGTHRVRVIQAKDAAWNHKSWIDKKNGDKPVWFLSCKFSLQVIDEGVDENKRIFPNAVNTNSFDGKCEMAHILQQIWGGTEEAKERIRALPNYVALGQAFKEALIAEPIVRVTTKWEAQYKDGSKDKKGREVYKTALSGMKNFKKRPSGSYDPSVNSKGGEVKARAKVIAYLPDIS